MFSLFDGHGGRHAADFAASHLHDNILAEIAGRGGDVPAGIVHGYLRTDTDFLSAGKPSGAAAVTALLRGGTLWVGHAGDCRAVLSRRGAAEPLTSDHKPERPAERARIEAQGGEVLCGRGAWRVQGVLGVSRAIGDRDLKPARVCPKIPILSLSSLLHPRNPRAERATGPAHIPPSAVRDGAAGRGPVRPRRRVRVPHPRDGRARLAPLRSPRTRPSSTPANDRPP